jgi:CCR4-NOT transcription complex subunit 9
MHQQTHHQQAHHAAAAAAASAAHYNRMAQTQNHNAAVPSISSAHVQDATMIDNVSEENRRTLAFIADLLNEETREAALLELSKKREQVPELALILWHSFGTDTKQSGWWSDFADCGRCYDIPPRRDNLGLHPPQPLTAYCCCIKSSL